MSATTDELQDAITRLTFNAYNNAPISPALIAQLQDVAAQLSPGSPLDELNAAISQLSFNAPHAAPAPAITLVELADVWSQLTNGTQTTNVADLNAIAQITSYMLLQEPDWAPSLWMNFDDPSTTLTVQVRGFYTLTMVISASPWWSNWPTYSEAASALIASIYLLGITPANLTPAVALAEDCGCAADPSASVQDDAPAAPAIHREPWRHWDAAEALINTTRIVPEGCAVIFESSTLIEHGTGRIYDPPPLSADAQAWLDAHRDDLRGGKNWLRRRQQQRAATPQSAPPWTYQGALLTSGQQYVLPQRISYMATFFGISQVATTSNVTMCIWPGWEPADSHFVVQPVLLHSKGTDLQAWNMLPLLHGVDSNGVHNQWGSGSFPIHMPQGVWGVIREFGGTGGFFRNGFYRGNPKNNAPNFNQPAIGSDGKPCVPFDMYFNDPSAAAAGVALSGRTAIPEQAGLTIEIPYPNDGAFTCTDINVTAVFGGLTVRLGPNPLPVNWNQVLQPGAGGGVNCGVLQGFANPTTNGSSQVTMQYASS
jgi:hypothetical protein